MFFYWLNSETKIDGMLKAAIVHFRFIIIHPFDGKIKTSKSAKIAKCYADTALREIKGMIEKGEFKASIIRRQKYKL